MVTKKDWGGTDREAAYHYLKTELAKMKEVHLDNLGRTHRHMIIIDELVKELDSQGLLLIFLMKKPSLVKWIHNTINLDKYNLPDSVRREECDT